MGTSAMGVGRGRLSSMVVLGVVGGVVNLQASWLWWKKEATTSRGVTLALCYTMHNVTPCDVVDIHTQDHMQMFSRGLLVVSCLAVF
jgi:hypothetical protein